MRLYLEDFLDKHLKEATKRRLQKGNAHKRRDKLGVYPLNTKATSSNG